MEDSVNSLPGEGVNGGDVPKDSGHAYDEYGHALRQELERAHLVRVLGAVRVVSRVVHGKVLLVFNFFKTL